MATQAKPESRRKPDPRRVVAEVVQIDETADIDLAVRHYVQMALAQIGVPVAHSHSSAA